MVGEGEFAGCGCVRRLEHIIAGALKNIVDRVEAVRRLIDCENGIDL